MRGSQSPGDNSVPGPKYSCGDSGRGPLLYPDCVQLPGGRGQRPLPKKGRRRPAPARRTAGTEARPSSRPPIASRPFRGSDHLVAQTNPPVRGRVSADRSEEAAQPLTTPRLVRKSSTDDSVRLHCMWGLGAFGRVTSTFPDATEVPLHGLRKDGSRHVP